MNTAGKEVHLITVLYLCEHFGNEQSVFHGVARSFELWLPAFDKSRFRVLVCSRRGLIKAADDRFRAVGVQPLYLGYGKFDPRNLLKLMKIISREKVDIIHAHGYGACTWGRIAGMFLKKPVIVHTRANYRTVPVYQRPVEWVLGPFTKYAFAVSESTKRFAVEKRHIPDPVVKVLYNGIPLAGMVRVDREWIESFRGEQGLKPGDRILGIVGRIEGHKGHIDALKAFRLVLKERNDVYVWIVGNGRYQNEVSVWIKENHLEDRVTLLGYRSDVLKILQCFDLQIFPSHMEGTPNTLYEAMLAGNAPVASTTDGQGEILEDGKTALMFEAGDYEKMAELILKLLKDDELRKRISGNVRERIKDFDMKRTIAALESTYERIMDDRFSPARKSG